jgi:hypothetical protein
MSVSNRLVTLKNKYQQINTLISDELSRPLPDSLRLFKLKLKRLKLKEKIHQMA